MNELSADQDHDIGSGNYRYRFRRNWAKPPRWWNFGDTGEIRPAADLCEREPPRPMATCTVLSRAAHPVMVIRCRWAVRHIMGQKGEFSSFVHGMTIDPNGHVWIATIPGCTQ